MSRFVIADISDAAMVREELLKIVPNLPSVPVQTILISTQKPYVSIPFLEEYPWFLTTFYYNDLDHLRESLDKNVIQPAENYREKSQNRMPT
jgi:hypothetical protein